MIGNGYASNLTVLSGSKDAAIRPACWKSGVLMGNRSRLTAALSVGVVIAATAAPVASATVPPTSPTGQSCAVEALAAAAPADTTLTAAEELTTEGGVEYCRVDGYVTTTDPGPNQVNFEVSMPAEHNGRFYFQGLGGTAGYVPDPDPILLAEGYAYAGSDTGNQTGSAENQSPGLDWSFMDDPPVALDHDRRGGHVATVAAQAITKSFYGTDELWRYHSGCSGGGRMGYSAAIFYPDDYDGIVIGAAGRDVANIIQFGEVAQYIDQNIDLEADPPPFIQLVAIGAQVLADFDAADGATDGMIWDPAVVDYSDAELDELFTANDLSPDWQAVARMILAGYDVGGATFMPQYPLAGIENWTLWLPNPPPIDLFFPAQVFGSFAAATMSNVDWQADADFDDVATETDFIEELQGLQFGRSVEGNLLNDFRDAGGKMVIWHGVNDPVISYNVAPYVYDEIVAEAGGLDAAKQWARLFPVPGLSHCQGGTGPQDTPYVALDALAAWVEDEAAPESLTATRLDGVAGPDQQPLAARTFLLCPYPQASVFASESPATDVHDASNWSCSAGGDGAASGPDPTASTTIP